MPLIAAKRVLLHLEARSLRLRHELAHHLLDRVVGSGSLHGRTDSVLLQKLEVLALLAKLFINLGIADTLLDLVVFHAHDGQA